MPKPPKPKRRLPNVEAVYSGGVWKFRAVAKARGARRKGSLRATQEEAYRDAQALKDHLRMFGAAGAGTLGGALQRVIDDARERGVEEVSLRNNYENPARAITSGYLNANSALEEVTEETVRWFVREALEDGLSPNTLRTSYLRVLGAAFDVAGLHSPVKAARVSMRNALKPRRFEGAYLTIPELGQLIYRMSTWSEGRYSPGRSQAHQTDLVILLCTTGIRCHEMGRILKPDVDLERQLIRIREPKDRSNPRTVPIAPIALKASARIIAGLKEGQGLAKESTLSSMAQRWRNRLDIDNFRGAQSLRRSFASGLESVGAPFSVTRDLLGHAPSVAGMTGRYLRTSMEDRRHWVSRLSEAIAAASGFAVSEGSEDP